MSAMAMSSLNPNAAPFIPAAFRRVEDFSPEWWELVKTTAWFRDHWFRQHQMYEDAAAEEDHHRQVFDDDLAALLPDDSLDLLGMVDTDDLFYTPDPPVHHKPTTTPTLDADVLRALSLNSPRLGGAGMVRHAEKPAQFVAAKGGAARHVIHQPR